MNKHNMIICLKNMCTVVSSSAAAFFCETGVGFLFRKEIWEIWQYCGEMEQDRSTNRMKWNLDPAVQDSHFMWFAELLSTTHCVLFYIGTSEHWMPIARTIFFDNTCEATKSHPCVQDICLFPSNPQNWDHESWRTYCWWFRNPAITLVQITTNIQHPPKGFTPQSIPIMRHFLGAYDWWNARPERPNGCGIWAFGTCQDKTK